MRSILRSLLPGLLLTTVSVSTMTSSALAQKAASPVSLKVGYLNKLTVQAADPGAANSEQLRTQAEEQLKRDLDEGNKRVQKMKDEKKPEDEIKKAVEQIQIEINAKGQALFQLVQNHKQQAEERLRIVAGAVAKEKGLDLVLDGAGVLAGGQKILDNGVDITEDVVKKINPNAASKTVTK